MLRTEANPGERNPLRHRFVLLWVGVLWCWGMAPSSHAAEAVDQTVIAEAVQQLIKESSQLNGVSGGAGGAGVSSQVPVFRRPHPQVKAWPVGWASAVLKRIADPLTGNAYRDAYVRWHLMWVVRCMIESQRPAGASSPWPADGVASLMLMANEIPSPAPYDMGLPPTSRITDDPMWEPLHQLRQEIKRWHDASRVTVGYPPFEKNYYLQEALVYAPKSRKTEIKKLIQRVQALTAKREQWLEKNPQLQNLDVLRQAQNSSVLQRHKLANRLNDMLRAYRVEVSYCLVASGDAHAFKAVARQIRQQINDRQRMGFDLTAGLYAAAYDGVLAQYDATVLQQVRAILKPLSRTHASYITYREGGSTLPHHRESRRHFADYVFDLLALLDHPQDLHVFASASAIEPGKPISSAPETLPYQAQSLSLTQIHQAIQRAVRSLNQRESSQGLARYGLQSDAGVYAARISGNPIRRQNAFHASGNLAVEAWAMLAAAESYQDPRMFKRIHTALSSDTPYVYDRAMRCLMMGQLSAERWRDAFQRDARFLVQAMSNTPDAFGGFDASHYDQPNTTWGDHANGQYGLLGLWSAARAGLNIPDSVWKRLDAQWRATQQQTPGDDPAGWALGPLNVDVAGKRRKKEARSQRVTAAMTAGGVAALTLTEHFLETPVRGRRGTSKALQKGLAWLNRHFSIDPDAGEVSWFYYMWTMQRVGQTSGYRTFNHVDWFRQVTTQILNRQDPHDGLWKDPSGLQPRRTASAFALLYLGAALDPLAVAKLQYNGRWNDRPHDVWNFVDWASGQYERGTTWQIADLDRPVYELIESPILFLSAGGKITLTEAQTQRLGQYLTAGGMLVLNPDKNTAEIMRSMKRLVEKLYPGSALEALEKDHQFGSLQEQGDAKVKMSVISNGVRPLIVQLDRDLGQGLENNQTSRRESFGALSSLYLYSVGRNPRRSRLGNHYIPDSQAPTHATMAVARIRYAGHDNPEPGALTQLRNLLRQKHGIDLTLVDTDARQLSPTIPLAFLTTTGRGDLTDEQIHALGQWLKAGGTLWLDAAGGSQAAVTHAQALLARLAPDQTPLPLPLTHPIVTGVGLPPGAYDNRRASYRRFAVQQMGPVHKPRLEAISIDGRPAILYSTEDITSGLAGLEHWGIFGYSIVSARHLVVNSVLEVMQQRSGSTMKP